MEQTDNVNSVPPTREKRTPNHKRRRGGRPSVKLNETTGKESHRVKAARKGYQLGEEAPDLALGEELPARGGSYCKEAPDLVA